MDGFYRTRDQTTSFHYRVARNHNVLGFALFFNSPIEDKLKAEKFTITNGTFPTGQKNHMYVAPVAVRTNSPCVSKGVWEPSGTGEWEELDREGILYQYRKNNS